MSPTARRLIDDALHERRGVEAYRAVGRTVVMVVALSRGDSEPVGEAVRLHEKVMAGVPPAYELRGVAS